MLALFYLPDEMRTSVCSI